MKHASSAALDRIEELLASIRQMSGLKERKRGIFYRRSKAFLHFHEDGLELYGDVRLQGDEFVRHCVTHQEQQQAFIQIIRTSSLG